MSKKNHRQTAHENTTKPPVSKSTKLKTFYECENLTCNLIQNCSPKMPNFFQKKLQMAANLMEKSSPQRNAHNLAGKEIVSSHCTAQGERRRPLPLSTTLIHPWTSFQFSGFHCPAGRLLRTHPVISPVIS